MGKDWPLPPPALGLAGGEKHTLCWLILLVGQGQGGQALAHSGEGRVYLESPC